MQKWKFIVFAQVLLFVTCADLCVLPLAWLAAGLRKVWNECIAQGLRAVRDDNWLRQLMLFKP